MASRASDYKPLVLLPDAEDACGKENKLRYEEWRDETLGKALENEKLKACSPQDFPPRGKRRDEHFKHLVRQSDAIVIPLCSAVCGLFHKTIVEHMCKEDDLLQKVIFIVPPFEDISHSTNWEFIKDHQLYYCDSAKNLSRAVNAIKETCYVQNSCNDDVISRPVSDLALTNTVTVQKLKSETNGELSSTENSHKSSSIGRISSIIEETDKIYRETSNMLSQQEERTRPHLREDSRLRSGIFNFDQPTFNTDRSTLSKTLKPGNNDSDTDSDSSGKTYVDTATHTKQERAISLPVNSESQHVGHSDDATDRYTYPLAHDMEIPSISIQKETSQRNRISNPDHSQQISQTHKNMDALPLVQSIPPTKSDIGTLIQQCSVIESENHPEDILSPYDDFTALDSLDSSKDETFETLESVLRPGTFLHVQKSTLSATLDSSKTEKWIENLNNAKENPNKVETLLQNKSNEEIVRRLITSSALLRNAPTFQRQLKGMWGLINIICFANNERIAMFALKGLEFNLKNLNSCYENQIIHLKSCLIDLLATLNTPEKQNMFLRSDNCTTFIRCNCWILLTALAYDSEMNLGMDKKAKETIDALGQITIAKECTENKQERSLLKRLAKCFCNKTNFKIPKSKFSDQPFVCLLIVLWRHTIGQDKMSTGILLEVTGALGKKMKKDHKDSFKRLALEIVGGLVYSRSPATHKLESEVAQQMKIFIEDYFKSTYKHGDADMPKYIYLASCILSPKLSNIGQNSHILHSMVPSNIQSAKDQLCLETSETLLGSTQSFNAIVGTFGHLNPICVIINTREEPKAHAYEMNLHKRFQVDCNRYIAQLVAYQSRMPGINFHVLSTMGHNPVSLNMKLELMLKDEDRIHRRLPRRLHYCQQMILAIKYCHSKSILLRKITAASFCVVKSGSSSVVKLYDFEEARESHNDHSLIWEGSKHDSVPTLWMADKSLCRYVYDITTEFHSCVIALYEVLSFGLHPHVERQLNVPIEVLMIEILGDRVLPLLRPSIPLEVYKIIVKNLNLDSHDKASLDSLLESIQIFGRTSDESVKEQTVDKDWLDGTVHLKYMRQLKKRQNKDIERGIPSVLHDVQRNHDIGEIRQQCGTLLFKAENEFQKTLSLGKKRKSLKDEAQQGRHGVTFQQNEFKIMGCVDSVSSCEKERREIRDILGEESCKNENIAYIVAYLNDSTFCREHVACKMFLGSESLPILDSVKTGRSNVSPNSISMQLANGMKFLHSNGILHCNLKADSVYLKDGKVVKIGNLNRATKLKPNVHERDFTKVVVFPFETIPSDIIPWCPVEVLETGAMSCYSDVAMFGITLWEILWAIQSSKTGMGTKVEPYAMCQTMEQIIDQKRRNTPLEMPQRSDESILTNLIGSCNSNPHYSRTLFPEILDILKRNEPDIGNDRFTTLNRPEVRQPQRLSRQSTRSSPAYIEGTTFRAHDYVNQGHQDYQASGYLPMKESIKKGRENTKKKEDKTYSKTYVDSYGLPPPDSNEYIYSDASSPNLEFESPDHRPMAMDRASVTNSARQSSISNEYALPEPEPDRTNSRKIQSVKEKHIYQTANTKSFGRGGDMMNEYLEANLSRRPLPIPTREKMPLPSNSGEDGYENKYEQIELRSTKGRRKGQFLENK